MTSVADRLLADVVFACADVETTGLEVEQGHRVCEVGIVRGFLEGSCEAFRSLVNPERLIPPEAARISGITDADVAGAPTFADLAQPVGEMLSGAVFVAHNAPFDIGFFEREFGLLGLGMPPAPVIDTMAIAERVFGLPVRNLAAVAEALSIHPRPAHRALDDVRATREVLSRGLEVLARRGVRTVGEAVEALLPPVNNVPLLGDPLPGIREALRNGLDLCLVYAGGRGDTERTVRPVRLGTTRGQVVLAAFCRTRQAPREFRLDRILAAEVVTPPV